MITKEIKNRVFNALESYKNKMNTFIQTDKNVEARKVQSPSDIYNSFYNSNKSGSKDLERRLNDIYDDVRASVRCGYIDKEEAETYIATCQEVVVDTRKEYIEYVENRIGEKEYFIQWVMKRNGWTRRQAEEAYE